MDLERSASTRLTYADEVEDTHYHVAVDRFFNSQSCIVTLVQTSFDAGDNNAAHAHLRHEGLVDAEATH